MIKVLTIPRREDGQFWYRIENWAQVAREKELLDVQPLTEGMDFDAILEAVETADALYFRFSHDNVAGLMQLIKRRFPTKPLVFDDDDDIHTVSPFNAAYDTYGTEEVRLEDGTMLWEQGVSKKSDGTPFDKFANRKRLIDYETCLETADLLTCTTNRLKEKFDRFNDAVAVVPNALNLDLFPHDVTVTKPPGVVRLVWAGGPSHFEDLMLVKDALKDVLQRNPQVELHLVGCTFPAFTKDLPEGRVITHPWMPVEGNGYRLACLGADIGLAPLEDRPFNALKSCLKWYEYAALGLPTVASKVAPYTDELQHEKNALLATPATFGQMIQTLIDDPVLRLTLATNARTWVTKNRSVQESAERWAMVFEGLVAAKTGASQRDTA